MSQEHPCAAAAAAGAGDCTTPPAELDTRALRDTLGRYATGVAVVTAIDPDGHPIGLTVNSFAAVSLEPPLVLWSLANSSHNFAAFRQASHHCINILTADQQDLSNRFATWPTDRFAGLKWQPGCGGVPVIEGCCAWFEVRNGIQHPSGDHLIFVGQVERFRQGSAAAPLLFHGGRYRFLAED